MTSTRSRSALAMRSRQERPGSTFAQTHKGAHAGSRAGHCAGRAAPPERARPSFVVIVEPDQHVRMLVQLTLGEIATVIGCQTSDEALSMMQTRGGDVALVYADMHLVGSVSSLELARTVIARWPGTHMLLSSGVVDPPAEMAGKVGFLPKPWRCADLLEEARAAIEP